MKDEVRVGGQPSTHNAQSSIGDGSFVPLDDLRAAAPLDLTGIRRRLESARGREYWRSLEEVADTPEFRQYLEREFPMQAPRDMEPLSRREFMRVMGAGMALAGVGMGSGCGFQRPEKIVAYHEQPESLVPGKPLFYATSFVRSGYAYGVLAESQMGRPTKLEGNSQHPASLGATDAFTQASLLQLYDPDRSQAVRNMGSITTWEAFLGAMDESLLAQRRKRGAGFRILTGAFTSPTLEAQLRRLLALYPQARVHQHEPAGQENVLLGARQAFGTDAQPVYHFDQAQRVLSLDANFLLDENGGVRYARDFAGGRQVRAGRREMNRLYVVESTPTITGAYADHRLSVRPSVVEAVARAVAAGAGAPGATPGASSSRHPEGVSAEWIAAVVADLLEHRGSSLVLAGAHQPPVVHALAHAINEVLGNVGKTVTYVEPVEVRFGDPSTSLKELTVAMKAGRVELLFILGSNPVYTAPVDLGFQTALRQVPVRVHLGLYDDETGVECQWHIPESHYLEGWSDARAHDGTAGIVQPLIMPLYATRSIHELVAVLLGEGDRAGYEIVREHWMGRDPGYSTSASPKEPAQVPGGPAARVPTQAFEKFWHSVLHSGVVPNSAAPAKAVRAGSIPASAEHAAGAPGGMEIVFRPDPTIWDGQFANNAWLQELPKPLSVLTWDNAALMSKTTARKLGVDNRDRVELRYRGHTLEAAVWTVPAHADDTVSITLGYGRTQAGKLGTGLGFNAYALRTSDSPGFGAGLEVRKLGGQMDLVAAQHHFSLYGRDLVRAGTLKQLEEEPEHPHFMHPEAHLPEGELPSLYPQEWTSDRTSVERSPQGWEGPGTYSGSGYNGLPIPAWGMVIDMNACIGCNACTIACQAENNIATVGKDQVKVNREMHWLRIDTYYTGDDTNPDTVFQPVACHHCEKAPCEPVCPVQATSHSAEGINEMTYNRCIGTRYCSNNCPYKVRRFNFLQFSDMQTPSIQLMRNPDVTVRARGVMEKCTYCIQRITEARIEAEKEDRPIRDGDVVTACQQVCPTQAILFGDTNDRESNGRKGSRVRQLKGDPLNYAMLSELNTRPRTSYLAKLRNPNPSIASAQASSATEGGH